VRSTLSAMRKRNWGVFTAAMRLQETDFIVFYIIGIAGALGKPWMVLATMGLMNVLTVALIAFAPANHLLGPTFAQERALYLPLALLIQWAIAAIVLAMDLIYRRTVADVTQAYEQAKRLDELKDQFIAHINHELRTPIMALHGYVEYMLTTLPELSHEEVIDSLSRASRTGHKLVALLESILDVRRIDQQTPFDREPVSIQEALEAALQMIDPREATPAHRAIAISVPGELRIWGEATRLQQILTNLISNAIKYSPPTTPIEIRARDVIEARMAPTGPWP
jgi:signal transduction histidine kinase